MTAYYPFVLIDTGIIVYQIRLMGITSGQDARTPKTLEFVVVGASRSLLLVSVPLRLTPTRGLTAAS